MSSIALPKNSRTWNASIKQFDASKNTFVWSCLSTGKQNPEEAKEVADAYQMAASKLYPDVPNRNDQERLKRVFRSMCDRAGVTLDDFGDGPNFAPFAADWLRRRTDKTKESTATAYTGAIDDFNAHIGNQGNIPMGRIDASRMQAWYDGIISDGRSTGTARNKFMVIASIFKRAHELGSIRLNPCAPVETLEVVQEERQPFTTDQEKAIFDHLQASGRVDWLTCCMLARWGALRLGDASNLSWFAISERDGHTLISYLPQKKTSKAGKGELVVIPALGPLADYIKTVDRNASFLCPSLQGTPIGGKKGLSAQFAQILKDAGIDRGTVERGKGGNSFSPLTFHSFRHSCTSYMMNLGVDEATRMLLTDHQDSKSHRRYSHSDAVKLAERLKHVV